MFKTVYLFDKETGAFTGEYRAQKSPMEPEQRDENGVVVREAAYIMPVHSTEIAPPPAKENEIPVFHQELKAWALQPDYRGQIWYKPTGEEVLIDKIGMPDALPEMPLVEARQRRMRALRQNCALEIVAGFDSEATGQRLHYPYEAMDQHNMTAAAVASTLSVPEGWTIPLKCFDGKAWIRVSHTSSQVAAVMHEGIAHRDALCAKMAGLDAAIEAASSLEEIESIKWSKE